MRAGPPLVITIMDIYYEFFEYSRVSDDPAVDDREAPDIISVISDYSINYEVDGVSFSRLGDLLEYVRGKALEGEVTVGL